MVKVILYTALTLEVVLGQSAPVIVNSNVCGRFPCSFTKIYKFYSSTSLIGDKFDSA